MIIKDDDGTVNYVLLNKKQPLGIPTAIISIRLHDRRYFSRFGWNFDKTGHTYPLLTSTDNYTLCFKASLMKIKGELLSSIERHKKDDVRSYKAIVKWLQSIEDVEP